MLRALFSLPLHRLGLMGVVKRLNGRCYHDRTRVAVGAGVAGASVGVGRLGPSVLRAIGQLLLLECLDDVLRSGVVNFKLGRCVLDG